MMGSELTGAVSVGAGAPEGEAEGAADCWEQPGRIRARISTRARTADMLLLCIASHSFFIFHDVVYRQTDMNVGVGVAWDWGQAVLLFLNSRYASAL
ncbi:hypothetical protein SDC9_150585 [bioreactor metagenome]|uniref:Uncharacterized protein n=1 Tax=bioreactor metagenome TaxID=1076179 RepID=A0A645ENG8_9ZZZZ